MTPRKKLWGRLCGTKRAGSPPAALSADLIQPSVAPESKCRAREYPV